MIYLHTEFADYFEAQADITALVNTSNIRGEPLEKYEQASLPGIVFSVLPGGRLDPVIGDRVDTLEVAIITKYGETTAQTISDLVRRKLRGLRTTAITQHTTGSAWKMGRDKCVVVSASEETTEEYVTSKEEGLMGYILTFNVVWREKS